MPHSRAQEIIEESARDLAIIRSFKADQIYHTKTIKKVVYAAAIVQVIAMLVIVVIVASYFSKPSPANIQLRKDIKAATDSLLMRERRLSEKQAIFHNLIKGDDDKDSINTR